MNEMTTIGRDMAAETFPAWAPLAVIPDDRRDGRDVLLWAGHLAICSWCDGWRDAVGRPVRGATHYADVEGPGCG